MEPLQSFYNNLFEVEITALGVITAGVFVFLQILYSNFSHKDALVYLRRWSLGIYGVLSAATILLTGAGALFLSLEKHDFFPSVYFYTRDFFLSPNTAVFILALFLLSISGGLFVIQESFKLLKPFRLLGLHLRRIANSEIRDFLLKKYGLPAPFQNIHFFLKTFDKTFDPVNGEEISPEKQEEIDKLEEERFTKEQQEYEEAKKDIENAEDVLEGVIGLITRAIGNGDLETIRRGSSELSDKLKNVFAEYSSSDKKYAKKAGEYVGEYSGELLKVFVETARRHNLLSLSTYFIKDSRSFCIFLINNQAYYSALDILKAWKELADLSISISDRPIFREIMLSYREAGDAIFEEGVEKEEIRRLADALFQHLGWLAERLIAVKGLEFRPNMHDSDYQDEFGAIFNCLFHFESMWGSRPKLYPLIYFDAVHVLFDRLIELYANLSKKDSVLKESGLAEMRNRLFDCAYTFYSFAQDALNVGNVDGVYLSAINLKQVYKKALELDIEEVGKNIIELITELAIQAASTKAEMDRSRTFSDKVEESLEEVILSSPHRGAIRNAVNESHRKFDQGDHAKKFDYIKSLGRKMNTNFGFMFDPFTGEVYPENDPRRY